MKTGKKLLALLLALAMVMSLMSTAVLAVEPENTTSFVVMSTTDVHGKCWDKNVLNDTNVTNSLLNAATAVKEARAAYGADKVIVVDNGDLYQGTPVSSYNINLYTQGKTTDMNPMAICLAEIGYTAAALGNHEFNYAWKTMGDIYKYLNERGVATLAANLYYEETGERAFTPYITKTVTLDGQEFTIGIIGIENTDCTRWDVPDNYPGIIFASPENKSLDVAYEVEKVQKEMAEAGVQCDFTILMYHAGLGSDTEELTYGVNTENQVLRTIKRTTGIDMVVAGHDHSTSYTNQTYTNKDGEDVLVVNSGGGSLTKSVFTASYDAANGFTVTMDSSENLTLSKYAVDADLKELIRPYAEKATEFVNTSVGTLSGEWDGYNGNLYLQQSDVMDLIGRAQVWAGGKYLNEKYASVDALNARLKEIYGADTTKQYKGETIEVDMSSTSVVTTSIPTAGELSMKGIYGFYKYDNALYLLALTGQEIKDLLEYNAENRLTAKVSNGAVTYGTTGDGFTNPVFYGLNFTYDMYQEPGSRVVIEGFSNGKKFDVNETYIFAINNYHLGNAGNTELAKYDTKQTIWSQTDDMGGGYVQDLIADYVGVKTAEDGGVYPTKDCAKNGEKPTTWSLSYSGSLDNVVLSDNTAVIGKPVTDLAVDSQVMFYHVDSASTMGVEAGYNGRAVVGCTIYSNDLYAEEGAAVLTVGYDTPGYTFSCDEGYLASSGTNNLSFVKTLDDSCYWTVNKVDGGVTITNVKNNVSVEYYSGAITTYYPKTDARYIFNLYEVVRSAAQTKLSKIEDGDRLVIYYAGEDNVMSNTASGATLTGVAVTPVETKTSKIMAVPEDAALLTVELTADGKMMLKTGMGYLTSKESGSGVFFAEPATEYSVWVVEEAEGGYYLKNDKAAYKGNAQYLEYYSGYTTYKFNASKADIYTFGLFKLGAKAAEPEPVTGYVLPVFETSDVHGYLIDTASGKPETYQYRLAYIADKVNDARSGKPATVLLLDGGDIFQGNVVSNLQDGMPMTAAYDLMGYDAVALGNHEFDWGVTNLYNDGDGTMGSYKVGTYEGNSEIPVLASNLYKDGEKVSFAKDYVIVEKTAVSADGKEKTVKIGLIGFVDDYAADIMQAMFTGAGYTVKEDYAALEALAKKLETEEGCDATVVIAHGAANAVAAGLPTGSVVDLVCGGHSHQNQTGTVGDVTYIQPKNQAAAYAYAQLVFGDNKEVSVVEAKTVDVTGDKTKLYDTEANAEDLDPELVKLSKAAVEVVAPVLATELGYVDVAITKDAIDGNKFSSTAGNWMTDLQNRGVGADVSFTNNGGIRTTFPLPEGETRRTITAGDVYTIAPFCNAIYLYEVTYPELLDVLSYAIGSGSSMGLRMSGIDCYYTGSTVTTLVKDGTVVYQDGTWTEGWDTKTVKISTNEYVATAAAVFVQWNGTDKLVANSAIDNETFIEVLTAEGKANNGYLTVDTKAHMIEGAYTPVVVNKFQDVPEGIWFYDAVNFGVSKGLIKGMTDTEFGPDLELTRGMLVTILYRLAGAETTATASFPDVPEGRYFTQPVAWAQEVGIARGRTDGNFYPYESVSRQDLAVMLYRYAELVDKRDMGTVDPSVLAQFPDGTEIGGYAVKEMAWAVSEGLINGVRTSGVNYLEARGTSTRAQGITVVYRYAK